MASAVRLAEGLVRRLREVPEPSGQERQTAQVIAEFLTEQGLPVQQDVGGHGVLCPLDPRPRRLLRADLDALPTEAGPRHRCGHDGHMAMLAAALPGLAEAEAPVAALFQPSEEDGSGMQRCLHDPRLASLPFEDAFAVHNLPGVPLGTVTVGPGALASTGLRVRFLGQPAHAAHPDEGLSPYQAMRAWADAVPSCRDAVDDPHALATLVHLRLGEERYGTSPGDAVACATLRGSSSAVDTMRQRLVGVAHQHGAAGDAAGGARARRLEVRIEEVDPFPETANTSAGRRAAEAAAATAGLHVVHRDGPFSWSEDFGHAVARWGGALVGLGSGEGHPPLHDASYSFPQRLLPSGIAFWQALGDQLAPEAGEAGGGA